MEKQFVEQLERVIEAEVPRPCEAYRGALQLQAPVVGGAHAAGHANGARLIWPGEERHGRRRVTLRIGEAK